METQQVLNINRERLAGWAKTLTAQHSTAVVVIGVGHDHASGSLHICIPDGDQVTPEFVRGVLAQAWSYIDDDDYQVVIEPKRPGDQFP